MTPPQIELESLKHLIPRIGETHLRQRLVLQKEHSRQAFRSGYRKVQFENVWGLMRMIRFALKATGMFRWGYRNYLDIQIVENKFYLPGLPDNFNGFRILQLSDLHLDLDPVITGVIEKKLINLEYDLAVITGDFRSQTFGSYAKAMQETVRLLKSLHGPIYGILGNHDYLEFVLDLETAGMQMLLNETVILEREGEIIYLSGVDDPYFYETDNLPRACDGIPVEAFSILLAHTPDIFRAAAASGYDLLFCGHTHGGQICLPGRYPLMTHSNCPRSMIYGPWRRNGIQGYTSAGTGSNGVPARFFCPPEITIHQLIKGDPRLVEIQVG